jgi:hypothetical protein
MSASPDLELATEFLPGFGGSRAPQEPQAPLSPTKTNVTTVVSSHDQGLAETVPPSDISSFTIYQKALFNWAMTQPGEAQRVTAEAQMQAIDVMKPQDPLEAAMLAQMLACNHQVMTLLGKAQRATFSDSGRDWLNLASRFMATYAKQMEALTKYQRKGKQTVVVEHMHAAAGSQVLVGNVETGRGQGR